MAHRVVDGGGDLSRVDRVVEGVAADLVRGLEVAGDREGAVLVRKYRQELPLDLGGELEVTPSAYAFEPVRVAAGLGDDVTQQLGDGRQVGPVGRGPVPRHREHAEPFPPNGHRQEDRAAGLVVDLDRSLRPERLARAAVVHPVGLDGHGTGRESGHRFQRGSGVVGEEEYAGGGAGRLPEPLGQDLHQLERRRRVQLPHESAEQVVIEEVVTGVVVIGEVVAGEVQTGAPASTRQRRRNTSPPA